MPRILRRLGWLFFMLMWIPFAGIFIGMIGFPDGSYSWGELPPLMRTSLIATGLLFGLSMLGLVGAPILSGIRNQRLLRGGERAEAVVLAMWDTGTTINQNPVIGFRLEVQPISGMPFEAETERLIPRLMVPQFQPGARVKVRIDKRSKSVALDL